MISCVVTLGVKNGIAIPAARHEIVLRDFIVSRCGQIHGGAGAAPVRCLPDGAGDPAPGGSG